jgi:hypothetical protein
VGLCALLASAQEYDVDAEISRTKRELVRVASERTKVREASQKDSKEFEEYQARTRERVKALQAETDSVRQQTTVFTARSDSLGARLSGLEAKKREYGLMQERLRTRLVALCDSQTALVNTFPPGLAAQARAALAFLRSELAAKSIDNIEGMTRLVTITNDNETQLMDIQIAQGTSPLADIVGTVYRLRIGGVFEAVVDAKGTKCALWTGRGDTDWELVDDPAVAARILKAVNVREGKTVPALVQIPFTHTAKGAGNE